MARVSSIQRSLDEQIEKAKENMRVAQDCMDNMQRQIEMSEAQIELLERVKANAEKNDTEDTEVQ